MFVHLSMVYMFAILQTGAVLLATVACLVVYLLLMGGPSVGPPPFPARRVLPDARPSGAWERDSWALRHLLVDDRDASRHAVAGSVRMTEFWSRESGLSIARVANPSNGVVI